MELPGKIALITGVSGFVGSRTARRLVQEGMHVRGLVRRPVDLPGERSHHGVTAPTVLGKPRGASDATPWRVLLAEECHA